MQPLLVHRGLVVPLPYNDVDTDQIIPKQFLKRVARSGFGECLFYDWRVDPAFALNQPQYQCASILVTGSNFGCGSSREHAAWALRDFGFRVILAPSFADIFVTNCTNNGIAAIAMDVSTLLERTHLTIDLERCEVRDAELVTRFDIDPYRRERLLHGYDEIAMTLRHEAAIAKYETRQDNRFTARITCA